MEFHPQKCQVLHITSKQKPVKFLYNIHSQTLEEVKTAKYLIVTIQNDLNWKKNICMLQPKKPTCPEHFYRET